MMLGRLEFSYVFKGTLLRASNAALRGI